MSKGLEALKKLKGTLLAEGYWQDVLQDCAIIETELKALEIIKEKQVNVRNLIIYSFEMKRTYEDYVKMFNYDDNFWELGHELLTEDEYNLLKEVLYVTR